MTAPLILTGMHRSGTSLVASLLPCMGIDLGQNFIPADFRNPRGYYEDVDFVRLQQAMVRQCLPSADAGCPDWGWTESETFNSDHLDAFRPQAAVLLQSRAKAGQAWGWKDPRTTLLLDFWARASRETLQAEARYLLLYRFPWEVADSVQRLADAAFLKHPSYGYRIWLFYNQRLLAFYRQHSDRCLLLSTNALLSAVGCLPTLLQDKLGLHPIQPTPALETMVAPTLFVSPQAREAQVAFVSQLYPDALTLLHELDQAADLSSGGQWPATATFPPASLPPAYAELYLTQVLEAHREQIILRQEVIALRQRVQTLQEQPKAYAGLRRVARRTKTALAAWMKPRHRANPNRVSTPARRVGRTGSLYAMQNTLEDNFRVWNDDYDWPQDGDEWDGQARACGQPYARWKQSVFDCLLMPNLTRQTMVLEIGPGHGRWSEAIAPACGVLILVELSPTCLAYCQQRLAAYPHIRYLTNDGRTLAGIADGSVDFIWSFDCFVHLEADVLAPYLVEIKRVLRPKGKAIIHHAGRHHWWRHLQSLEHLGWLGRCSYHGLSLGCWSENDGERSRLSKRAVALLSQQAGLTVEAQCQRWGAQGQFGVPRYGDWLTVLRNFAKP